MNHPVLWRIVVAYCLFLAVAAPAQVQFPWPVTPFDQSHLITGNFAEYRSTSPSGHFHSGTDIPKADGSPVYPVKDGRVTSLSDVGSSAFVRVDDVAYVHIAPNPALSIGDPVFASQTVLGTILPGLGHVHFTNGFVGSERNSMLPNSGLTPYEDPWPPIIRFVRFYQNHTQVEFPTHQLSGLVDIVVKVDEQNGPPGSATSVLNNGTYKIGYKILSADTATVVFEPPNNGVRFQFDTKPDNAHVNTVYFRPLSSTTSHVYQVTNNVTGDNFWNTAALPAGEYVVMVFAEDTRSNTDTVYVPVEITESDITPPLPPTFRFLAEIPGGMRIAWFPNTEEDLRGYRLYFSFDNQTWSLFRNESVLTAAVNDTTVPQILNRDVYFRLTAVDNAPVPNESGGSDVYGMSNGEFSHKVLIVDGFDRTSGGWNLPAHDFAFAHGSAILAHQVSFDTAPNETVERDGVDLQNYDAVIWILGDEAAFDETFSAAEQERLGAYLSAGGNLLVSGSEIAWDLAASDSASSADRQFLRDFLKAEFVADAAEAVTVHGSDGAIFAGMSFNFGQIPYPVETPDIIRPVNGAVAALQYTDSSVAGVQYAGPFGNGATPGKLVVLAFPFETIAGEEVRNEVMGRVLDFFFGLVDIAPAEGSAPLAFALRPNFPNPFNPETVIEFDLPAAADVQLVIFNALGQRVRKLLDEKMTAGRHRVIWRGRDARGNPLPSGLYFYRISAGHHLATRKMILIR